LSASWNAALCGQHVAAAELAARSDGGLGLESGYVRRHGGQPGPAPLVHAFPGGRADGAHVRRQALAGAHVLVRVVVHPVLAVLLPAHVVEAGRAMRVVGATRSLYTTQTHDRTTPAAVLRGSGGHAPTTERSGLPLPPSPMKFLVSAFGQMG